MLKKIDRIKKFGVYADFHGVDLPEFQEFNLIFGWNYSGKTTFSRIFRSLEFGKIHEDYSGASFSFLNNEDKVVSCGETPDESIRVFNDDFKSSNFRWDTGKSIEPILLLGKENIELSEKLKASEVSKTELEKAINEASDKSDALISKLSRAETDCGNQIARELRLPRFNKSNLRPVFAAWEGKVPPPLSDEEFAIQRERANSSEQRERLPLVETRVADVVSLYVEVDKCLSKSLSDVVVLQALSDDQALSSWVEEGVRLHKGKDVCEFCLSSIGSVRRSDLDAHFSDTYSAYKEELSELLETAKESICHIDGARYVKSVFFSELYGEWERCVEALKKAKEEFNQLVDGFISAVNDKLSNPFDKVQLPEIKSEFDDLVDALKCFNELIKKHNKRSDNFKELKVEAVKKLTTHYAADAMMKADRFGVLTEIDRLKNEQTAKREELKVLNGTIEADRAKLSEAHKGAEKLNELLNSYFGKNDLHIRVNSNDTFEIVRRGVLAKNLSEGEKTAISFCYFMVTLLKDESKFKNLTVYIDDPISSLDSNHLFHVNSLIKNYFWKYNNSAEKGKKCSCLIRQLFISTHNYEFFQLVFEWMSKGTKNGLNSTYYVQRNDTLEVSESKITACPSALTRYKSEYLFVFSCLKKFLDTPQDDVVVLFNLGNMCRRFLERYFVFKFVSVSNIDKHIDSLIEDSTEAERVRKFAHFYSHALTRGAAAPVPDLNEAVAVIKSVFSCIEKQDKQHYEALCEAAEQSHA